MDFDLLVSSDDGSLKETHDIRINAVEGVRAADKMGQTARPGPKLKEWAESTGFVNIKEHVFKIPYGPWAKDPQLVSTADSQNPHLYD